jgi:hypothetical protein
MTEPNEPLVPPPPSDQILPPPATQQYPTTQYPTPQSPAPQYPTPQNPAQQYPAPPGAYPPPQGTQYGTQYSPYGSGPYPNGPYTNGPYGYPQGYYPQPAGTSGLAIASLILGICGFFCVTPFIGLGLGIGALSKISKTGQGGRGLAIAGIILSSAWILLIVLGVATGNFHFNFGGNSGPGPSSEPNGSNGTSA